MQFSLRASSRLPIEDHFRFCKAAEKHQFDAYWVSKDLFKRDNWVVLTALASQTTRIKLGTSVVNPYSANPAEIAMSAATLDEYSRGRVLLGIGSGSHRWISQVGIKQKRPLTATKEAIYLIRALLSGERAEFDGKVFKRWTKECYFRFTPYRKKIPIYIGASQPKMFRLTGEIADGGLPRALPPEYFDVLVKHIEEGAKTAGRALKDIDIAACVWGSIAETKEEAEEAIKNEFVKWPEPLSPDPESLKQIGLTHSDFQPFNQALESKEFDKAKSLITEQMLRLGIVGTPEYWIKRIEGMKIKGLRHLAIWLRQANTEAGLQILGEKVLPYFKG